MKRNKNIEKSSVARYLIIILIFIFLSILFISIYKEYTYNLEDYISLNLSGIYYESGNSIITLSSGCYYFEFSSTKEQGNSIEIAYRNIETKRPLTHDIVIDIMRRFWIEPKLVRIDKIANETYYATIILKNIIKYEEIDIRPSDGVAIAVRANIPIYVHKSLIKNLCSKSSFSI